MAATTAVEIKADARDANQANAVDLLLADLLDLTADCLDVLVEPEPVFVERISKADPVVGVPRPPK
jgi:hypothetical protein